MILPSPRSRAFRLTWPLPALGAWALSWGLFIGLRNLQAPLLVAMTVSVAVSAACSGLVHRRWRRLIVALGFPLSLFVSGLASGFAAAVPAWAWLLPLALLAFVYPVGAWRDAPLFPTPRGALAGLADALPMAEAACILDAGCGLGDGLRELHRAYPKANLVGLEWSWPLRIACAWRCRFATVRRGDIWAADWSAFDLVYVFQHSGSMARMAAKAAHDLRPGAWLASLEFRVPALAPTQVFACPDGRRLWLYRAPFRPGH